MKYKISVLYPALLTAMFAVSSQAEEPMPTPPQQHAGMAGMGGMADKGGMSGMSDEMMDKHLRQRQEHEIKMHEYMHRIADAKDDKEKEKLKEEQRKLMKEHMQAHRAQMHEHMQQMMQHRGGMKPGEGSMQHGTPDGAANPPPVSH